MTDRHAPPYRHAAVLRAALCTAANGNLPYDHRLNGTPPDLDGTEVRDITAEEMALIMAVDVPAPDDETD